MQDHPADLRLEAILPADEPIQLRAVAGDAVVAITDRRIAIADAHRLMMDTPIQGLRRIQFDIERGRPATLVFVPDSAASPPQVLAVPPDRYDGVSQALAYIGKRLAGLG